MPNRSLLGAVSLGLLLASQTARAAADPGAAPASGDTTTTVKTTVGPNEVEVERTIEASTHPTRGGGTTTTTKTTTTVEADDDRNWFGLSLGAVASPLGRGGEFTPGSRVTSNPFRACLDPMKQKHCSSLRGFDVRLQFYRAKDAWEYPRWIGYFRSGYGAGVAKFDPREGARIAKGDATSLAYYAVPLFFGGSVYAFKRFPIRPYAGAGLGFDVVRLHYTRKDARPIDDASLRFGFELHAGIEARISNVVALTAEVQQLWSVRRKLPGVPDFSNTGLTVMAGLSISIPSRIDRQMWKRSHTVATVTRNTAPPPPPAPAPVIIAPPPVIVAPAPAVAAPVSPEAPAVVAPAVAAPAVVAPAVAAPAVVAPAVAAPAVAAPAPVAPAPVPTPPTPAAPAVPAG